MAQKKRLMRSETDRKFLGVCAGLGRHFGIDPLWVRLLFAVAPFTGVGLAILPIYFVLAFVMPTGDPVYDEIDYVDDVDFDDAAETLGDNVVDAVRSATGAASEVAENLIDSGRTAFGSAASAAADAIDPVDDASQVADDVTSLGDDVVETVNKAVDRATDGMESSASS